MAARILIVEDNKEMSRLLQLDMKRNGYEVATAANGVEGLRLFQEFKPDLVVLDVALPMMNGLTVCQRIRDLSDIPILMMTAHAVSEEQIAEGLNVGADEYMIKPLRNLEFHARVRALLRRARLNDDPKDKTPVNYHDAYLSVDVSARRVCIQGEEVRLTPTEFKLLATFIQHAGEVLTFQQLLERVWGYEYTTEHHYPRIYVSHLRRKIEPDLKNPTYIHNEYGIGYRFIGQAPH
ncbi:MAG: response regulator transcription factor [Chloroflexi bacterium]|nr:response regulator transcription factor [Chloroflexota bacterium]